jgi:hypothetical protein
LAGPITETIRPVDELFHWPLALAWALVVLAVGLTLVPTHRQVAVAA